MDIKQSIQLTTASLNELLLKGQSIDFRLNEERWSDLTAGDHIEFWEDFTGQQTEPRDDSRRVIVRILRVYMSPSFPQLFDLIEREVKRLGNKDSLLAGLRDWWSEDIETRTGVLAFHVKVVEG